jgi:hypothetical protein
MLIAMYKVQRASMEPVNNQNTRSVSVNSKNVMPFCMFPDENEPIKVPLCKLKAKQALSMSGVKKIVYRE